MTLHPTGPPLSLRDPGQKVRARGWTRSLRSAYVLLPAAIAERSKLNWREGRHFQATLAPWGTVTPVWPPGKDLGDV